MSYGYSSNQYDTAFRANNLQNWHAIPKIRKNTAFPKSAKGYSQYWANDRGHLLPGVPRSTECAFGDYQGTWDMPLKIPPYYPYYTGRTNKSQKKLLEWREKFDYNRVCDAVVPKYTKEELLYKHEHRPEHPSPPNTTPASESDDEFKPEAGSRGRAGFTPGPHGYLDSKVKKQTSILPPISRQASRMTVEQVARAESQISQKKARIRKASFYDRYAENSLGLPSRRPVKETRLMNKAISKDNVKFCQI